MADFTTFKRGGSFVADPVVWTPIVGGLQDLIGATLTSSILDQDRFRHDLTVTNPTEDGINFIMRSDTTSEWAVGPAYWDIKVVINGTIVYTQTYVFNIVPQITL